MVPWLEGGPHRIYAFTFCLLLPPYCAQFGELRLTLFSACCHQGRAWARAAPYLTQPVLSTEAVKNSLFVFFLLKQPGRASHSARTVPAQCPHSARNSARTVPAGKNCTFAQTRQQENLLFRLLILKTVVFACGHCAGTVAGTVRALCGHCAGTVQEAWLCRLGYITRYDLDHLLGLRQCPKGSPYPGGKSGNTMHYSPLPSDSMLGSEIWEANGKEIQPDTQTTLTLG